MSMISEQVNLLRDAVIRLQALDLPNTANEVKKAADTIEELSAKLANANMERSTAYYNDGWIPVNSGNMPETEEPCWIAYEDAYGKLHVCEDIYCDYGGWYETEDTAVKAWMYVNAPAPYKPKGEK